MKQCRIIQLSDLHGESKLISSIAEEIESADLIVLSGDLTHFGGKREAAVIIEMVRALNPQIVAVPGNCDRAGVGEYLQESGISVDGVVRHIQGYKICGIGGSLPTPVTTPSMLTEEQFSDRFEKLAAGYESPDIAVIHEPPFDSKLDRTGSGEHVGSRSVREFLERSAVIVCLTGHIHESIGIDTIGSTQTVNPGSAKNGNYAVIEVDYRSASISLKHASR